MWNVAIDDFLSQAFHNGSFSDPRLSNQNRVVLGSTVENFDDTDNLLVTANDRVNIPFAGNFCDIDAELL